MCLYNYNNKIQNDTTLSSEEYDLLSDIYRSINSGDNDNVVKLTQQLIQIQSSTDTEKINILENSINSLR